MNCLLDTQILIWYQLNSPNLAEKIYDVLMDTNNTVNISQISLFEIAIKQKIGKLPELDLSINDLANLIEQDGFNLLALNTSHLEAYGQISLMANHRDPFDRLLLATALSENMPVISADAHFKLYEPQVLVVGPD